MLPGELDELHFIVPIENLNSIRQHGILCQNEVRKRGLTFKSLANPEIQQIRAKRMVSQGRVIHDYANLYVNGRNSTLFSMLQQKIPTCLLSVSPTVLDVPGVHVSRRNAASEEPSILPYPSGLEQVQRNEVMRDSWFVKDDAVLSHQYELLMAAEVLVPSAIGTSYLVKAYASSANQRTEVLDVGIGIPVSVNKWMFFG